MPQGIVVVLILLSFSRPAAAASGSIQSIQEAVACVQARLDELATPPATAKTDSLSPCAAHSARELDVLRADVEFLCEQVALLAYAVDSLQLSQAVMADLQADIELLKSESERLLSRMGEVSPQLASLDDEMAMPVAHGDLVASANVGQPLAGIILRGFVAASGVADDGPSRSDFGIDQAELDISGGEEGPASFLAEVECVSNGDGEFDFDLEQGYLSLALDEGRTVVLSLGKFNSPIGWEGMDAPQMYQVSYAGISNCLPGNLTGLAIDVQPTGEFSLAAFVANGWDVNRDNNRDKTVGGRLGYSRAEWLDLGMSVIHGPEQDDNVSSQRTVFDLDFTATPTASWMVGGEVQFGQESGMLGNNGTARWRGGLITNEIALSKATAIVFRYDYLDDVHGLQTDLGQAIHGFTLAPCYSPADGFRFRLEGKYLLSSDEGFLGGNGEPTDGRLSLALGCSYSL